MILGNGQRRIVAYLDGLPPIGDLQQARVNALRELQVKGGDASQVATKSDVDIVPERSERDAVRAG